MTLSVRGFFLLVMLVGIYVGSYLRLSQPIVVAEEARLGMVVSGYVAPHYEIDHPIVEAIFFPAYLIDHASRPDYWSSYSDFDDEFFEENPRGWNTLNDPTD